MATIEAGSYYIFNNEVNLDGVVGIVLSAKYTVFTPSGGKTASYMYYHNGGLRTSISSGSTDLLYNVSVEGATLGWVLPNYRFLFFEESANIDDAQHDWLINNGTFITYGMYIKNGIYTFNNRDAYISFTQFSFTQNVDFIVGESLSAYGIIKNTGIVGYNISSTDTPNYVYPYYYNDHNSEYYKLTFNSDEYVTKECAVWFAYMALFTNTALNVLDVLSASPPPTPQGYTITFNSNGGSAVPSQTDVTIIEELPTPTKQGYSFSGWYYDSMFTNRAVVGDTLNSDVTLYAMWSLLTYSISFIVNTLIASPIDTIYNATSLPSPLPTPQIISPQYIFDDWFYDSGYSNRAYGGTAISSNTILYAKFSLLTYDITFVTNGGTAVSSITGVSNLPSPLPTTTREGYVFDGWYYDDEYSRQAYAMDVLNSNVTLYAKWEVEIIGDFVMNVYQFSGEEIMVDKRNYMLLVGSLGGTMRDEINIVSPTFTMSSDTFPNFNYVYIPNFKRYYYVANINCVRYNFYEITLTLDVLMSYREGILSLNAFIDRNENEYDNEIVDNQMVIEQGVNIQIKRITTPLFRDYSSVAIVGTDLGGMPV